MIEFISYKIENETLNFGGYKGSKPIHHLKWRRVLEDGLEGIFIVQNEEMKGELEHLEHFP